MSTGRAAFTGRYPKEIFVVAEHNLHWREGEPSYWEHRIYSTKATASPNFNRAVEAAPRIRHKLEVQLLRIGVAHSGYELLASWRRD